jgi:uncharacterized protein (DUF1800 family)
MIRFVAIQLTALSLFLLTSIFACATYAADAAPPSDAQILHFLNRISFGPAPGDMDNVRRLGISNYLEQQLHPQSFQQPVELADRLQQLSSLNVSSAELMDELEVPGKKQLGLSQDQLKEIRQRSFIPVQELTDAKILRAVMSPAQLQEVMTDFWFNHFNVFAPKGLVKYTLSSYERDAIRPYALGKFRDLLMATAHHPAMLFYLDNWLNTDPNSLIARGKKIGINENYGREVMELHTLGVNGGYTQQDVTTLAHILTGWGLGEGKDVDAKSEFYFEPRRHDFSNQTFLGTPVAGGGTEEIEGVLDMLARHPSTAKHIAFQLAQYFVADEPPQSLVDKLTATYGATDGDISEMLRVIFRSPEFWNPQYYKAKFKPPFRYIISALRTTGSVPPAPATRLLHPELKNMGEQLYYCLTPNGYSNTNDQWLNSDALLKRIDFAKKLANFLDNSSPEIIESSFGKNWSANTLNTIASNDPKQKSTLLLSSPEFVYY